jgi:NADPH:quinone reductase-like Zn-dependent oxidoreductase
VAASARAKDADAVRALGADTVVDLDGGGVGELAGQFDAAFDTVGGDGQARLLDLVRAGGTLVSVVKPANAALAAARSVRPVYFIVDVTRSRLAELAELFNEGRLRTNQLLVMPLAQARQAHEMLDGRRPRPPGKIVLQP